MQPSRSAVPRNALFAIVSGLFMCVGLSSCRNNSQDQPAVKNDLYRQAQRSEPGEMAPYSNDRQFEPRQGRRRSKRGQADRQAQPGVFDFYLLNLSWSPEFCVTHSDSPECGRGLGFVVHGLWPQDLNGDYPEDCSDAPGPANPQLFTDIIPTASLVEHEWQTHGTCSGLAAEAYFNAIRRAFQSVKIPHGIGTGPSEVSPDDLLSRFAHANPGFPQGSFALSCGNNRLTAIEICLSRDLKPESCQGVRSCRANAIRVTPQ